MTTPYEGITSVALADPYHERVPLLEHRRHRSVNTSAPIRVADTGKAAWAEHAAHLGQRSDGLEEMHQHHMGKDGVEGAIGKGQPINICDLEADVHHPTRSTQFQRLCDLRRLLLPR